MKKIFYVLPVVLFVLVFAGCKRNNQVQPWNNINWEFVTCTVEEKAAENCNMVYYPVCWDDGETYWNACVACSSQKIDSYKMWECDCNEEGWICSVSSDNFNNEQIYEADDEMYEINDMEYSTDEELELLEQDSTPELIIDVPVPNF